MDLFRKDSEQNIAEGIRQGNQKAFRQAFDACAGYLMATITRYVPDNDIAQDLLQETFIKIFGNISRFEWRGKGSFKAWTSRIAANEALRWLKSNRKDSFMESSDSLPEVPDDGDDGSLSERVPPAVIQKMIQSLPEGYRAVFNMFVFEQMSHKEIGEKLGITETTSASQFLRARKKLAQMIREYESKLD